MCTWSEIEDIFRFILKCPKYKQLRSIDIKRYYWQRPSAFKLVQLLSVHKNLTHALQLRRHN